MLNGIAQAARMGAMVPFNLRKFGNPWGFRRDSLGLHLLKIAAFSGICLVGQNCSNHKLNSEKVQIVVPKDASGQDGATEGDKVIVYSNLAQVNPPNVTLNLTILDVSPQSASPECTNEKFILPYTYSATAPTRIGSLKPNCDYKLQFKIGKRLGDEASNELSKVDPYYQSEVKDVSKDLLTGEPLYVSFKLRGVNTGSSTPGSTTPNQPGGSGGGGDSQQGALSDSGSGPIENTPSLKMDARLKSITIRQNGQDFKWSDKITARYIMVDLSEPWCGHCRTMANHLNSQSKYRDIGKNSKCNFFTFVSGQFYNEWMNSYQNTTVGEHSFTSPSGSTPELLHKLGLSAPNGRPYFAIIDIQGGDGGVGGYKAVKIEEQSGSGTRIFQEFDRICGF